MDKKQVKDNLRQFIYSENEMGPESAKHLATILNREYPINLRTLVLNNVKFLPDSLPLIMDSLLYADQI